MSAKQNDIGTDDKYDSKMKIILSVTDVTATQNNLGNGNKGQQYKPILVLMITGDLFYQGDYSTDAL